MTDGTLPNNGIHCAFLLRKFNTDVDILNIIVKILNNKIENVKKITKIHYLSRYFAKIDKII